VNTGLPLVTNDPFPQANIVGPESLPHNLNPHFSGFFGTCSHSMAVPGMAPTVGVNDQQPPNSGAFAGLQQYFGGLGAYGAFNQNAFAQAQGLGRFNLNIPPTPGVPPMGLGLWPTFGGALVAEAAPATAATSSHGASFMQSILSQPGPDAASPLSSGQLGVSGNGSRPPGTTPPMSGATLTGGVTGSISSGEGLSAAQVRVEPGQFLPAPHPGQWAIPMPNMFPGHAAQPVAWHVSVPLGIPNPTEPLGFGREQPPLPTPAPFLPGVTQARPLFAGLPARRRMPGPGNISSLESLLGGLLPTVSTPQVTIDGVTSKRARFAPTANPVATTSDGPASSEKDDEKDLKDGRQESIVEKRLKQNREAARRSRERKRQLKEELHRRMPVLQKQHDDLAAEVDQLMKSMPVHSAPCFSTLRIRTDHHGADSKHCQSCATHQRTVLKSYARPNSATCGSVLCTYPACCWMPFW
jgi:hypothetical protein